MTLTTEQLRARAKFWREKAVEAKWESVSIAQDMLQNADAFEELAANREAQPVLSGENCWSCGKFFTYAQHSECDGYCPHCNAPVDLDEEEIGDEA